MSRAQSDQPGDARRCAGDVPTIRLVPARPGHAAFWYELRHEPEALRFNPMENLTVEQLRQRLGRVKHDLRDRSSNEFRWIIEIADDHVEWKPVGTASLVVNWKMLHAEVGYHVAKAVSNRGIGTNAVRQLVDLAFADDSPLHRLFAFIAEENVASMRLIERVGFRHEGRLRDHYRIGGRQVTEVVYGLLRREWDELGVSRHEASAEG